MAYHQIHTEIEILATPERVWSVLLDFPNYPHWNPFISEITGHVKKEGSLRVTMALPGKNAMTFRPTVLEVDEERELRWRGRLIIPGLFDGEHYFRIEPVGSARTVLTHGEYFSGILAGTVLSRTRDPIREAFVAMNRALKERVEKTI
jgi:hypothetical protein